MIFQHHLNKCAVGTQELNSNATLNKDADKLRPWEKLVGAIDFLMKHFYIHFITTVNFTILGMLVVRTKLKVLPMGT